MRLEQAFIVGKREYLLRIRGKAFWIATLAVPLLLETVLLGPQLLAKTETRMKMAIVDAGAGASGGLGGEIQHALTTPPGNPDNRRHEGEVTFDVQLVPPQPDAAAQRRDLDGRVRRREIGAWIWLGPDALTANRFEYHAESVSNLITQQVLQLAVSQAAGRWKLRQAGYDAAKIATLMQPIEMQTVRISDTGSHAEAGKGGFFMALTLFFILYTGILIYGNQVMQGVLEEKGLRIIEVLSASLRPSELMLGKLGGICLVAMSQISIWAIALASLPQLKRVFPHLPEVTAPTLPPVVWLNFFLLFIAGFFLYATFYAMLGAAFNSPQEAQQLAGLPAIFIAPAAASIVTVINDPDSTVALVLSLVPPITPLVMMLRVATHMPPLWQLLTAYALLGVSIAAMIWLCARVYRVGILMYGKKPTLKEIWHWVRHA